MKRVGEGGMERMDGKKEGHFVLFLSTVIAVFNINKLDMLR
jgi:hypothetical protein